MSSEQWGGGVIVEYPKDPYYLAKLNGMCANQYNKARNQSPELRELIKLVEQQAADGKGCPIPDIRCGSCSPDNVCGVYNPKNNTITICSTYLDDSKTRELAQLLIHELTHALQRCKNGQPAKDDCSRALSDEIQAYFCAGECSDFNTCLGRAIGSACNANGGCTDPQKVAAAYDELSTAWNKKGADYCFQKSIPTPIPTNPKPGAPR